MRHPSSLELALAAMIVEAAFGYPAFVYRAIGHPVTWMGTLLAWLDHQLNRDRVGERLRRWLGVFALAVLLVFTAGVALALDRVLANGMIGAAVLLLVASSMFAQRSLHEHVRATADALDTQGLQAAREAVSKIVGRNPDRLDESGVARAAIESLAENFSDGVVAPAFWLAVARLPGAAVYKATNTADSMIGHRTPRHAAFGWAAARLDDVVNLPASRLSALLLALAAAVVGDSGGGACRAMWRDASWHRSPNAGWPEAAMAGALSLQLAGPRVYGEELVHDAFMGDGRRSADAADIRRALRLFRAACLALWLLLLAAVVIARG